MNKQKQQPIKKRYYQVEIQRPLIAIETCQGACTQCLAKKKVLLYRKPIQAVIEGNEMEIGKTILLCLNCLAQKLPGPIRRNYANN